MILAGSLRSGIPFEAYETVHTYVINRLRWPCVKHELFALFIRSSDSLARKTPNKAPSRPDKAILFDQALPLKFSLQPTWVFYSCFISIPDKLDDNLPPYGFPPS